jgi:hypothetical protein
VRPAPIAPLYPRLVPSLHESHLLQIDHNYVAEMRMVGVYPGALRAYSGQGSGFYYGECLLSYTGFLLG